MANPTFHIPDVPSRWPRRLLWLLPVLPLLLVGAAFVHQGHFLAERALRLALGDGPLSFSLSLPSWDGALRLSDVRFGDPTAAAPWLTARNAEVSGHGWWWLLRNASRQNRLEAPLAELNVVLEGVDVAQGMDPALGELAPAGLSGAPLETLGCPATTRFDAAGLLEAGLPLQNRLEFSYRVDGSRLATRIEYRLEDSASFQRELAQRLPMPLSLLVIDQYPLRTESERWRLLDLGFSRVRHKRCAERGELIALVDRHVGLVQTWANGLGLAAPESAWASYRRYVRDGGILLLQLTYPEPAPLDEWFDRPRPASLLALSEATLRREEQISRFVPASAFTGGLAGSSPKRVQRLMLQDTLWIDPDKALVLLEPERSDLPTDSADPGMPEADIPMPPPSETPSTAEPAPQPSTSSEPAASPAARDRSTLIPEARIVVVGEQASRRLEWAQLEGRIGARLRITTRTGSTRVVELVAWSPGEITIRQRIGGGMAESRIQREMVREVVAL